MLMCQPACLPADKMRFKSLLARPGVAFLTSSYFFSTELSHGQSHRLNPLLDYKLLPKFNDIQTSDIQPAMEVTLDSTQQNFKNYENKLKTIPPEKINYQNIIEELEVIQAPLTFSWGVVKHLMSVKNNDELRKVHDIIQPSVVKFNQELGQNKVLYDCLMALKGNQQLWGSLDEAQQRIVDCSLRDMKKSGVGLSTAERAVFNQFQLEVSELSTRFSNNVLDSTKAFKLTLNSQAEIEGLPASAKALLAQQAVREGFTNVFPIFFLVSLFTGHCREWSMVGYFRYAELPCLYAAS